MHAYLQAGREGGGSHTVLRICVILPVLAGDSPPSRHSLHYSVYTGEDLEKWAEANLPGLLNKHRYLSVSVLDALYARLDATEKDFQHGIDVMAEDPRARHAKLPPQQAHDALSANSRISSAQVVPLLGNQTYGQ